MPNKQLYSLVRVSGSIMLIPLFLIAGLLGGYYTGEAIRVFFHLGNTVTKICVVLGTIAGIHQSLHIIWFIIKEVASKKKGS